MNRIMPASVETVTTRRSVKAASNFIVSCGYQPGVTQRERQWYGSGFTEWFDMTFDIVREGKDFHIVRTIKP